MPPELGESFFAFAENLFPFPSLSDSDPPSSPSLVDATCPEPATSSLPCSPSPYMLKVHRCRLIDWSPSPVVALAASVDGNLLAAARDSGDIEIWTVAAGSTGWACKLRIPGQKEAAISSLVWCLATKSCASGRLFSAGLNGHITEWDLGSLSPKAVVDSYGGPVWALAAEPKVKSRKLEKEEVNRRDGNDIDGNESESESEETSDTDEESDDLSREEGEGEDERIAVACDDGCVRLFSMDEATGLQFRKAFPKVAGRILSVVWSTDRSRIYAGDSEGRIRCWDVASMREVYRITGSSGKTRKTDGCIWALAVLRDETLVSGDGSGSTLFWDGKQGTLIQAHSRHKGDVLALAAAPSHETVFSAGMDGQVVVYHRIMERDDRNAGALQGGAGPWAYLGRRRLHTHDVRALAVVVPPAHDEGDTVDDSENQTHKKKTKKSAQGSAGSGKLSVVPMLVSGGNDTQLFTIPAYNFSKYFPHAISPSPQAPHMELTHSLTDFRDRLLMVQQSLSIDIWRLEEEEEEEGEGEEPEGVGLEDSAEGHSEGAREGEGEVEGSATSQHVRRGEELANLKMTRKAMCNGVLEKRKAGSMENEERTAKKVARGGRVGLVNGVIAHKGLNSTSTCITDSVNSSVKLSIHKTLRKGRKPTLLAQIKSTSAQHISCSAISSNGRYLAFSDWGKVRFYELEQTHGNGHRSRADGKITCKIKKRKLPSGLSPSHKMVFSVDSSKLILACRTGSIVVVDIESTKIVKQCSSGCPDLLSHPSNQSPPSVCHMAVSPNGRWLGLADSCGHISTYDLNNLRQHWVLPTPGGALTTAMAFHSTRPELVVASSLNEIHILDVEKKDFSLWSKTVNAKDETFKEDLLEMRGGITGLSVSPAGKEDRIIAYSSRRMCSIDLSSLSHGKQTVRLSQGESNGGREREEEESEEGEGERCKYKSVPFDNTILFLNHTGAKSLFIAEKNWEEVVRNLPPPLYYHKYGT